jgi:hypothetical protein
MKPNKARDEDGVNWRTPVSVFYKRRKSMQIIPTSK